MNGTSPRGLPPMAATTEPAQGQKQSGDAGHRTAPCNVRSMTRRKLVLSTSQL
jgi:hypothetical protein